MSLVQGHPASPRESLVSNCKLMPFPQFLRKTFSAFNQKRLESKVPSAYKQQYNLIAFGRVGKAVYLTMDMEETESEDRNLRLIKGKPAFSLAPHTPQGRNPVRISEFHENEPQSLHRLIQISQLHMSESFPHPSQTTAPGSNLVPSSASPGSES